MYHYHIYRGKGSYLFDSTQKNEQKNDKIATFLYHFHLKITPSFFIPSIFIVKGAEK